MLDSKEETLLDNRYDNPYNDEPVFYCKRCLSLKIRSVSSVEDSEYCDECGCGDIGTCTIQEYEEMYQKAKGHKYLEEF